MELPLFSEKIDGMDGYFYYINMSSITRTRYFHVVISETGIPEDKWGLTDDTNIWD